jgi:ABC-type xylose transport system permease subunit
VVRNVFLCNESILGGFGKVTNLLLGGLVLRNQPPNRGLSVM